MLLFITSFSHHNSNLRVICVGYFEKYLKFVIYLILPVVRGVSNDENQTFGVVVVVGGAGQNC